MTTDCGHIQRGECKKCRYLRAQSEAWKNCETEFLSKPAPVIPGQLAIEYKGAIPV